MMGWILVGILILCTLLTGRGGVLFNALLLLIGLGVIAILALAALSIIMSGQ